MKGSKQQRFEDNVFYGSPCGCHYWIGTYGNHGYGCLSTELAHRVSYELYKGPIPKSMVILHSCDNRKCVNPNHLFLGTNQDNVRDMVSKGRQAKGKLIPQSKLDESQVQQIRALLFKGVKQEEIARLFNVGQSNISYIKTKTWKHI